MEFPCRKLRQCPEPASSGQVMKFLAAQCCAAHCWWQRRRGEVLYSPPGAFCRGAECTHVELIWCPQRGLCVRVRLRFLMNSNSSFLVLWYVKLNLANFHSFYLFSSRMLFLLQRWWILHLWYNSASPEWCYVLEVCPSPNAGNVTRWEIRIQAAPQNSVCQILLANTSGFCQSPGSEQAGCIPANSVAGEWGRQVCLNSLHFTDLTKLLCRLQFAFSVPGFQNHTLCSLCHNLVFLDMQECGEVSLWWTSVTVLMVLVTQHEAAEEYRDWFKTT